MLDCEHCGKRHRDQSKVDECGVRAQRRALRVAKVRAELERRRTNAAHRPFAKYIRKLKHDGTQLERIVSALKKDYPSPSEVGHPIEGNQWSLFHIAWSIAEGWNIPLDTEAKALLLLEKHHLGYFTSVHPFSLVDWGAIQEELNEQYDDTLFFPHQLEERSEQLRLEEEERWIALGSVSQSSSEE